MLRILKPRILCADDHPDVLDLLSSVLATHEEYAVETEINSAAIVEHAKRWRPDLIILDITMAEVSGIEAATALRREAGLRYTAVVFYSGASELRDPALKAAGNERAYFVEKGLPITEIAELVRKLLSERLNFLRDSLPGWVQRQLRFS